MNRTHNQKGFTLVEMAIVLAIIGLLIGGVMAGRSMLRSAELKTITAEFALYQKAINNFYDRYQELPGDMSRATEFWPTAANCPGTHLQGTTDGSTCAGDGDGRVENTNTSSPTTHDGNANSNEWFRLWQHLVNAGFIEGSYNGVTGPGHIHRHGVPGVNVPASNSFNNVGWSARWINEGYGNSDLFIRDFRHVFMAGGEIDDHTVAAPFLTPAEMFKIDAKMDDGKPATGSVITHWLNECTDASGNTDYDADYLLSESGNVCTPIFVDAF